MQAPPANAQKSDTPFKDVVDLGTAIARAGGSMRPTPKQQAVSASGCSLPRQMAIRTSGMRARTSTRAVCRQAYPKIKMDKSNGPRSKSIAAFDPALNVRDDKEEARVGNQDHRFNHWTAVRDGLMNAHADIFPQVPAIVKILPDPIDQMKLFELIQIIPSPTKSALASRNLVGYRISDPKIMGYLRNNSMFTFGQADRARTSQPSAKFLMRCGSSTKSSNGRLPGSTRSRSSQRVEAGRLEADASGSATPPSERTEDAPSRLAEFLHRRRDTAADDVPAFG